jgi:DNA-binding response OmpR family regulator
MRDIVEHPRAAPISFADHVLKKGLQAPRILLLANDMSGEQELDVLLSEIAQSVERVASISAAQAAMAAAEFDLVVVDIRPDLIGYQAIGRLRMSGVDKPLVFVSALSTPAALARAYAAGADEVIAVPEGATAMKARLQAAFCNSRASGRPRSVEFGSLCLDAETGSARINDCPVVLLDDEYAALELLIVQNGAPVAMVALAQAASACPKTVHALVSRLRRKLSAVGGEDFIRSIRGLGYALCDVRQSAATRQGLAFAA